MYVQQQIQWPFLNNLKWHQQPSQDVRQCLNNLSYESFECICRRLSNHFFKTTACFDGESAAPPSAPKTPSYGKYNCWNSHWKGVQDWKYALVMVIPCSWNKVQILSAKDVFLSRTFSRICLILATCVWRYFRFCDSISSLACFSVFRSSGNLSLYNCLCSSKYISRISFYFVQLFVISWCIY